MNVHRATPGAVAFPILALLGLLALPAPAAAGATAAASCQANRTKTAAKYAACRANAEMKAVKTAGLCSVSAALCYLDSDCGGAETCEKDSAKYGAALIKCQEKFGSAWSKAEEKGGGACSATPAPGDLELLVAGQVGRVAWELTGTERYVDNGDGTITDRRTGLVWEKKVGFVYGDAPPYDYANLHLATDSYPWSGNCSVSGDVCQQTPEAEAACLAGTVGDTAACLQCAAGAGDCGVSNTHGSTATVWDWLVALNASGFAGRDDWRVPTRAELSSLVDDEEGTYDPSVAAAFDGVGCDPACLDIADPACSCTNTYSPTWTSSIKSFSAVPWILFFLDGGLGQQYYTTTTGNVRAVRGRW